MAKFMSLEEASVLVEDHLRELRSVGSVDLANAFHFLLDYKPEEPSVPPVKQVTFIPPDAVGIIFTIPLELGTDVRFDKDGMRDTMSAFFKAIGMPHLQWVCLMGLQVEAIVQRQDPAGLLAMSDLLEEAGHADAAELLRKRGGTGE